MSDRFEIETLAGVGGMGTVYRAHDRAAGKPVALKFLTQRPASASERFEREAEILRRLEHDAIVSYVAHGVDATGALYLAMEWLEGEDLATRLERKALSIDETLALARRAAAGLTYAHGCGVLHRDIKPSNLFLPEGRADRVKLVDFGIARAADAVALTRTGALVGTPAYMAPEQARDEKHLDGGVDLYALGCVLYECLVGRPAFSGNSVLSILARVLVEAAPRASRSRPDVPLALDDLLARLMEKEPERRPTGAAVIDELFAIVHESATSGVVVERVPPLSNTEQRLLSIILATPREAPAEAATLAVATESALRETTRHVLGSFGARIDDVVTGAMLVTLEGQGVAIDQAARAARCALRLQQLRPDLCVALATGHGLLTEEPPLGEVIDRGVLLSEAALAARADAVWVDSLTAGLLGSAFSLVHRSTHIELRAEVEPELREQTRLMGRVTTFVGRERELRSLRDTWRECVEEPRAAAVLVTAPPGAGKSRLGRELLRGLIEEAGVECWHARGIAMAGAPFQLAGNLIRAAAGVTATTSAAAGRSRLRARVHRFVADSDALEVTVFLGELAALPFPDDACPSLGSTRQNARALAQAMRDAFEAWIEAECRHGPRLIALEDLHWGDRPTVELIDAALRRCRQLPLMVFALARPDVEDVFPKLWAERELQTIRLRPLSAKACEQFARDGLGDAADDETVRRITTHAGGNALYLEELVRAVVAGARTTELPPTVLAMVSARLESLPAELRRALRAASIFGERFRADGVAALVGDAEDAGELDTLLAQLADQEILMPPSRGRGSDGSEHAFRHALVRDASYATLTADDRRRGHRLAAEWLERRLLREAIGDGVDGPTHRLEERGEELALHARSAGEHRASARYFRLASRNALRTSALADAVRYLEEALLELEQVLATDDVRRETFDLRFDLYPPLWLLFGGAHEGLRAHMEEAERIAIAIGDDDRLAMARGALSGVSFTRASYRRAIELAELVLEPALHSGDTKLIGFVSVPLTGSWMLVGDFSTLARRCPEMADRLLRAGLEDDRLGQAYPPFLALCGGAAIGYGVQGDETSAERWLEQLRASSDATSPLAKAFAESWLSWACYARDELELAVAHAYRSIEIGDRANLPTIRAIARYALGLAYAGLERPDDALGAIDDGLRAAAESNYAAFRADAWCAVAQASLTRGDVERCLDACGQATRVIAETGERKNSSLIARLRGDAALRGPTPDEAAAERHFAESLAIAAGQDARVFEAHALLAMLALRRRQRRAEEEGALVRRLRGDWKGKGSEALRARLDRALALTS